VPANSDGLLNNADVTVMSSHCSGWSSHLNADVLPLYLQPFRFPAATLVTMQLSPKQSNSLNLTLTLGNLTFLG